MRSDLIGPRTWLLLAVAGWAVLTCLLALAGMGSRIVSLADDPSLVQALPTLPKPAAERLGPLDQYAEISQRPVFASDRKPHAFFLEGQGSEQAEKGFDYVLTSVLITPRVRLAILQVPGEGGPASAVRVKLGEAPPATPGWRLAELEPRRAVFEGPEGQRTLELRVFDGQGGAAPTQLASRPNGAAAVVRPPAPPIRAANTPPRERPSPSDTQGRGAPPSADAADPAPPAQTPLTTEQQMQAIRERIEARRRQMREQQNSGAPATD